MAPAGPDVVKAGDKGAKHGKAGAPDDAPMLALLVRPAVEGFGKIEDDGALIAVERAEVGREHAAAPPPFTVELVHWLAFQVQPGGN